jgi:hypothetical protein
MAMIRKGQVRNIGGNDIKRAVSLSFLIPPNFVLNSIKGGLAFHRYPRTTWQQSAQQYGRLYPGKTAGGVEPWHPEARLLPFDQQPFALIARALRRPRRQHTLPV